MPQPLQILLVEDNPQDTELVLRELRRAGFEPVWRRVDTEAAFLDHLRTGIDVILSDFQMPQFNGFRALELLKESGLEIPFILVSGTIGEDTAVEAMKLGATDYLMKDRLTRLGPAIDHALEESRVRRERKLEREALRLRETALGEVSQGVLICDENGLVIYANASFTNITGYAQSEILGRRATILEGPETDPATSQEILAATREKKPFEGEILNYRKDGSIFWNDLSLSPIRDKDGGPVRFIGILRDVTERKRVEEALRWETALFEAQVNSALDGILVVDSQGKKILQNQRLNELWKIPPHIAENTDDAAQVQFVTDRTKNPEQFIEKVVYLYSHPDEISHDEIELKDGTVLDRYSSPVVGKDRKYYGRTWIFRDITARKRAEEEARQLAGRLTTTLESITDGFITLDRDWCFTYINRAAERMLQLPRAELLGQHIWAKFPEARGTISEQEYERAVRDNIAVQFETFYPPLDTWFDVRAFPSEQGLAVYFRDITAVRQAGEALRESEERFSGAFEHAPIGVALVAPDGRWLKVNRALCDLVGYSEAELLARTFQDITYPDDLERDVENVRKVLDGKIPSYQIEKRYVHRSGHVVTVLLSVSLLRDAQGHPRYFISQMQDISERKRAQQALSLALERSQLAVKAGKAGTWELDLLTGKVNADDQIPVLFGLKAETAELGMERWMASIHPDDLPHVKAAHEVAAQSGKDSFETEFRIFREDDGNLRFIRSMGVVLRDESGRPVRLIGINWDVTEERLREEKLAEALSHEKELSEKARAGERAKSEFLAVMSHEVRTPMNGIIGFAELLAQASSLSPEYHNYARTIVQSSEALLRILDDILDFSRLEAGRLQILAAAFSPRDLLQDVHSLMAQQAREKKIEILLSVAPSIPEYLEGDGGRLRQILLNIVGNAIKFTQHGTVGITLKPLLDQPSTFVFSVKDSGIGITPEQMAQIFQPFAQADSSISRRFGGTGLGLAISRRLAELLGGELSVKSQPGIGSEFFLTLPLSIVGHPLQAPLTSPQEPLDASFAARHPLRILVVEDDRINLKLIQALLRRLGYAPLAAENGREAVEIFRKERPDCLLMDLQMPEMDGIEATVKIRAMETSSDRTPAFISALTANIFPADRQHCFEAGMDDYLNKPVKLATLAEILVKACASKNCLV